MHFISSQMTGLGIGGRKLFPTINCHIPSDLVLANGIYAAKTTLSYPNKQLTYNTAMHFGPRPVLGLTSLSLELHLIDIMAINTGYNKNKIEVEVVEKIREIMNFDSIDKLRNQISEDIVIIKNILAKKQ